MTEVTQSTSRARKRPSPDEASGAVVLAAEDLLQLREHARRAYPEECCGVLLGEAGDVVLVRSTCPTDNRRVTRLHDRYEVDPREILRLDRAAERRGLGVVGFYHSHPDHPPRPSATDAEQAWPGYIYLIAAVTRAGEIPVRAWSYDEERRCFRELSVRVVQQARRPRRAGTQPGGE